MFKALTVLISLSLASSVFACPKGTKQVTEPAGTGVTATLCVDSAGQAVGTVTLRDAKKRLVAAGEMKNGRRHGVWRFYKNGKLSTRPIFDEGVMKAVDSMPDSEADED